MKTCKLLSAFTFLLILSACTTPIPANYGIYVFTDHAFQNLNPQKTNIKGNLLESASGLKGSSGNYFKNTEYLIAYEKDINPKEIVLSKLQFQKGTILQNVFGDSYVPINLWTSKAEIEINIEPVEGKKDMYKIIPIKSLDTGFYALHFGSLTNKETFSAFNKIAYDFVIGNSVESYPSYEIMLERNENAITSNAEELLRIANESFNKKDYTAFRKIYISPGGNSFDNNEWALLVEGFENWFLQAGKIKSSRIINREINDASGTFYLETEYEKAGIVKEELVIIRKDNSYFITHIGSN